MAIVKIGDNIRAYIGFTGAIDLGDLGVTEAFTNFITIVGTGAMYNNTSDFIIEDYGEEFNDYGNIASQWAVEVGKLHSSCITKEQAEYYGIELRPFANKIEDETYYICANNIFLIPEGITSIANNFLENGYFNKEIKTIIIGKDVEIIGDSAFEDIHNDTLEQVIFDGAANLKSLGARCFYGNGGLKTVNICEAKPVLGEKCFKDCTGLQYINFGAYLENIPAMCFDNCKSLIEFNTGNTIKSFEISSNSAANGIFIDCNSITYFTFHEDCVFDDNGAGFNKYFKVSLNAGSNCDENGLQITEIRGASTHAQCHAWSKLDNRATICTKPYLILNHLDKKVIVNCYPKPWEDIDKYYPIKHRNRIWYLKTSKIEDTTKSPLVVHDKSQKIYISY